MTAPTAAEVVLAKHARTDNGGPCVCGWNKLGRSHAAHQASELANAGLLAGPPNPRQWLTTDGAAQLLGVHVSSVYRYVDDGDLTRHHPDSPPTARAAGPMFWRPEVEQIAAKLGGGRRPRRPASQRCPCGLDPRYAAPEAHDPPCEHRKLGEPS